MLRTTIVASLLSLVCTSVILVQPEYTVNAFASPVNTGTATTSPVNPTSRQQPTILEYAKQYDWLLGHIASIPQASVFSQALMNVLDASHLDDVWMGGVSTAFIPQNSIASSSTWFTLGALTKEEKRKREWFYTYHVTPEFVDLRNFEIGEQREFKTRYITKDLKEKTIFIRRTQSGYTINCIPINPQPIKKGQSTIYMINGILDLSITGTYLTNDGKCTVKREQPATYSGKPPVVN
ncbi:hypothetical protein BDF22DRAFT_701697, partial [Syncephalis plumigaleata]